jgi:hypothetical protein
MTTAGLPNADDRAKVEVETQLRGFWKMHALQRARAAWATRH